MIYMRECGNAVYPNLCFPNLSYRAKLVKPGHRLYDTILLLDLNRTAFLAHGIVFLPLPARKKILHNTLEVQKTILVVDDDPVIREYVSVVLSKHNYTVLIAESGDAALKQSREHSGPIHLLLSNVQMPGITGIELGTTINLERPETRVMLMSGFASGMLILNEGWHFLHKPFFPAKLRELVSALLSDTEPDAPDLEEHRARIPPTT